MLNQNEKFQHCANKKLKIQKGQTEKIKKKEFAPSELNKMNI
jgi:hypothetical protein